MYAFTKIFFIQYIIFFSFNIICFTCSFSLFIPILMYPQITFNFLLL